MCTQNSTTIFIVDDNKIFSTTLKSSIENAFEKRSLKIHLFETGESCLKKLPELKPQLIILDYFLDSKVLNAANGLLVLEKIKEYDNNTSVIMLTSNDFIEIALKSFHRGVLDYVVKSSGPFKKINDAIQKYFTDSDLNIKNEAEAKELLDKRDELTIMEKEIWAKQLSTINNKLTFQTNEKVKNEAELIIIKADKLEIEKSKLKLMKKIRV
jgi:DNA-binding NtrC family response regulator